MFTGPRDAEELAPMRDTWVFGHALEHGACEQNILAFEQLDEACNRIFLGLLGNLCKLFRKLRLDKHFRRLPLQGPDACLCRERFVFRKQKRLNRLVLSAVRLDRTHHRIQPKRAINSG